MTRDEAISEAQKRANKTGKTQFVKHDQPAVSTHAEDSTANFTIHEAPDVEGLADWRTISPDTRYAAGETPEFQVTGWKNLDGQIWQITARADFKTVEIAREFAAQFPKSYQVHGGGVTGGSGADYDTWGTVSVTVNLSPDKVNGGTNENGLKRMRKFLGRVNHTFRFASCKGCATPEQLAALVNGGGR